MVKLRSNTRKDYVKMANVDSDLSDEPGFSACRNGSSKNNNNNGGSGEIINEEFILSEEESIDGDLVESSDEEVRIAKKELESLKKKQRDLARKNKLEKIAEEKKALKKSLVKSSEKRRKSDQHVVTVASLRKMDDVVDRVDQLMDQNLKIKCVGDQYCDSDSEYDSGACSARPSSQRRLKKMVEEEKEAVPVNHRSGKSKSITSHVLYPQEWPHSHLALHFVNKKKDYEVLCRVFSHLGVCEGRREKVSN